MKFGQLTLCLWAITAGASLVEYEELCPDSHETKHELQPGEWVLVKCGWVGSHDGKSSRFVDIPTPAACAQLCSDVIDCTHSSWGVAKKCLLSGSKFTEREVKNSVLLVKTIPDDPEDECPEDNPYCDDEDICEEKLEESKTRLEKCEEERWTYQEQLAQCLTDKEALTEELFGAVSPEPTPNIGTPKCDSSHDTIFTAPNEKRFKIDCRKGVNLKPFHKYNSETFARCIDECAYNNRCNAAEFVNSGQCKLFQIGEGDPVSWSPRENRSLAVLIAE